MLLDGRSKAISGRFGFIDFQCFLLVAMRNISLPAIKCALYIVETWKRSEFYRKIYAFFPPLVNSLGL